MFEGLKFGTNVYRFPEFGGGHGPLVDFVRTAETLGFNHVRFLDHVVGINVAKHDGIANTPYTGQSTLRECFTLLAYLSAVTTRIEFATGVLVLPQRQTVLVAKQAAEIDILSGGRLTLGVGLGYNQLEYQALGANFKERAAMFEEQVQLLRLLWTGADISFEGRFHNLVDVNLSPRPVQRPIPLFFGIGRTANPIPPDKVLARCGRLADGWLPIFGPDDNAREAVVKVHRAAIEAGRDPATIIMEMGVSTAGKSPDEIRDAVKIRQEFGASRINVRPEGDTPAQQIDALKRLADILGLG